MKFLFKILILINLFLFSFIIFLPKTEFYNMLEKQLVKENIIISNEVKNETFFGLNINGAELYYDGLNISIIENLNFNIYFFKNNITFNNIKVSSSFNNILPSKINNLKLQYSIFNLRKVFITSKGEFGEFLGEIEVFDKKIKGVLIPSNIMKTKYKNILTQFKLIEGKYTYEQKY